MKKHQDYRLKNTKNIMHSMIKEMNNAIKAIIIKDGARGRPAEVDIGRATA